MSKSRPVYWMRRAEPLSLPLFSPVEIIPPPLPLPDLAVGPEGFSHRSPVSPHPGPAAGPPPRQHTFATLLRQPKCKGLCPTPVGLALERCHAVRETVNQSSRGRSRVAVGEPHHPPDAACG